MVNRIIIMEDGWLREAKDCDVTMVSARREMINVFLANEEVYLYGNNVGGWWIGDMTSYILEGDIILNGFSDYKKFYLEATTDTYD